VGDKIRASQLDVTKTFTLLSGAGMAVNSLVIPGTITSASFTAASITTATVATLACPVHDYGGALSVGGASATAVNLGSSGITTTVKGDAVLAGSTGTFGAFGAAGSTQAAAVGAVATTGTWADDDDAIIAAINSIKDSLVAVGLMAST